MDPVFFLSKNEQFPFFSKMTDFEFPANDHGPFMVCSTRAMDRSDQIFLNIPTMSNPKCSSKNLSKSLFRFFKNLYFENLSQVNMTFENVFLLFFESFVNLE